MIPFHTTLIQIERSNIDPGQDPWGDDGPTPTLETIQTGVRAVVSMPSATDQLAGGMRIEYDARLTCDPCQLQADDTVIESDGTTWRCLWVRPQLMLGFDHMVAQLRLVTGAT